MQVGWSETAESRQAVNNQMTVNNQMSGDWQGNVNSQMSGGWQGNVNNQYGYVQDTGYNQGVYNNQMGGNYAYQQPYGYNAQKAYNTLVEARLLLTAGTCLLYTSPSPRD